MQRRHHIGIEFPSAVPSCPSSLPCIELSNVSHADPFGNGSPIVINSRLGKKSSLLESKQSLQTPRMVRLNIITESLVLFIQDSGVQFRGLTPLIE